MCKMMAVNCDLLCTPTILALVYRIYIPAKQ